MKNNNFSSEHVVTVTIDEFEIYAATELGLTNQSITRCLYSICRGIYPIAKALINLSVENKIEHDSLIDYWQSNIRDVLTTLYDMPDSNTYILAMLILNLGPIPSSIVERQLLANRTNINLLDNNWLKAKSSLLTLECRAIAELFKDSIDIPIEKSLYERLIPEFECHENAEMAIKCALYANKYELAESLFEKYSRNMIYNLNLLNFKKLTDSLDKAYRIRSPLLLLDCTRSHFLLGDLEMSSHYFNRLLVWLEHQPDNQWIATIPEQRRQEFIAGIQIYNLQTGQNNERCRNLVNLTEENSNCTAMALLQKTLQCAPKGDINHLSLIAQSGFFRSQVLGEHSLFVVFSIIYFWSLILSCRTQEATIVLKKVRESLLNGPQSLPDTHLWLEILDLLALRLKGNLREVQVITASLLKDANMCNNAMRKYYLLTLSIENLLIHHEFSTISSSVQELLLLRKSPLIQTFWLPSPTALQTILECLNDQTKCGQSILSTSDKFDIQNGVNSQSDAILYCKIKLHQNKTDDVLNLLTELGNVLSQSGQWLRYFEVLSLKAVCLYQSGHQDMGVYLFTEVVQKLDEQSLLGSLFDPFLSWKVFLHHTIQFQGKQTLIKLLQSTDLSINNTTSPDLTARPTVLSRREIDVLRLLAQGLKNNEIASQLNLSVTTIRTHLQNIYAKFGVDNRAAALAFVYQHALI
ncbi:MAG: response regulator transcription factor [Hahellaceae bacterium]|nr:response regulator transcription factor [Hahellaceae bacterium]